MIKQRSKLSYLFVPKGLEYTVWPNIYVEKDVLDHMDLFPDLVAHEAIHLRQQISLCKIKIISITLYLILYFVSKSFRLKSEAEAYAESLKYSFDFNADLEYFSNVLASKTYRYCANTPFEARNKILGYIK